MTSRNAGKFIKTLTRQNYPEMWLHILTSCISGRRSAGSKKDGCCKSDSYTITYSKGCCQELWVSGRCTHYSFCNGRCVARAAFDVGISCSFQLHAGDVTCFPGDVKAYLSKKFRTRASSVGPAIISSCVDALLHVNMMLHLLKWS